MLLIGQKKLTFFLWYFTLSVSHFQQKVRFCLSSLTKLFFFCMLFLCGILNISSQCLKKSPSSNLPHLLKNQTQKNPSFASGSSASYDAVPDHTQEIVRSSEEGFILKVGKDPVFDSDFNGSMPFSWVKPEVMKIISSF